jgi:methyltransferase (TIGR00027 family)
MAGAAEIRDVSDTAIWVAYFRGKESDRADAMFRDPLAKLLSADRGERIARSFGATSSYTEWTVLMRTVLIDEFILRAIADGADAVVNLGAGLDTRPYRMQLPPEFPWVEADFPHMVGFKNTALHDETPRCRLQRVGVDLSDAAVRQGFLAGAAPQARKVLVLTEGVIPYLTEEQVARLAADLRAQPRFAFWLAEYFAPPVYEHLRRLSRTPMLANSPFRFFPADWVGFFQAQGWERKEIHYSTEVAKRFHRRPPIPWLGRLLVSLMSKEKKERMWKMTGYALMTPRPVS